MRYYIICGEVSGDLHGASLMHALKKLDSNTEFRFWGGDKMEAEGGTNVNHIQKRAFMGFTEVIKNLFTIKRFIIEAQDDIASYKPDRLVFIDYPGFNLRIANWAHKNGFITHYYISPKVWAWNTKRALKIKETISHLYAILPFEVDFYKRFNYPVHYVGNPLMDAITTFTPNPNFRAKHGLNSKPIIALLPGSRTQELKWILPEMLKSIDPFLNDYQVVLAVAPGFKPNDYLNFEHINRVKLIEDGTYNILSESTAALVTSGTATLETALLNVPQVVCYKTGKLNYLIGKQVIKVPFISLVNLIAGKEIVKELIQNQLNSAQIQGELKNILDGNGRLEMLENYKNLQELVGPPGASQRTAQLIIENQK
jgi:lipid-A-disaccharide synthase